MAKRTVYYATIEFTTRRDDLDAEGLMNLISNSWDNLMEIEVEMLAQDV